MNLLLLLQATGTLLAILLVSKIMWKLKSTTHTISKNQLEAPEPNGRWPIIGHLHLLGGQTPIYRTLAAMADKHGPIFKIWLGSRPALVVSSKEALMECFTVNDCAFLSRPRMAANKYMGFNGAISALGPHGQFWREIRKVTTLDLLSNRQLESQRHVRNSEVESCIKELYALCIKNDGTGLAPTGTGTKVDMSRWFRLVSMNVMLRVIAGKRYCVQLGDDQENSFEAERFARAMDEFMLLTGAIEVSDVIPGIEWVDLQGNLKSMKRVAVEMNYFMSMWLEEHVERRDKGDHLREERDFMDVLLSLFPGDKVLYGHKSKDIIKGTALSLILGGSDTTTASMTWALALLLNHNKALKAVQEELDTHVGRERLVEDSDIKNLVYLQASVKETLRLYPPGPLSIPRESIEDCHVGGYFVPKGTRLISNLWKLHRDPRAWPDPDEFRPERFVESGEANVRTQQFEYLPFSSGRRSCPGGTAAFQMMHLVLARLLQSFDVAAPDVNVAVDMTEGLGLTLPRADPLEALITPRLPCELYQM